MSQQNKDLDRRLFSEVWNKGHIDIIDEIFSEEYVNHTPQPGRPIGKQGLKLMITTMRAAFPDLQMIPEDVITEGNKIVTRWTLRGIHKGDALGFPATNKTIRIMGIGIHVYKGGKIIESWTSMDSMGLAQQLGMIPQPGKEKS
jgi:steroid delta-isomerase-like uncharacterized protein